ncbi:MAG: hypothetical protein AAGG75_18890 [Bacteroidota bacterium]
MTYFFRLVLSCSIAFFLLTPQIQAQFVNFEETWKEFLANDKTSNISKLTQPSKDDKVDYAKYCLMFGTTHFCAGELDTSEELISDIKQLGPELYGSIPGFKERFDDLELKISAYHKIDRLWKRFLIHRDVSLGELEIDAAGRVCEKGTLAKYSYMRSYAHYCEGDLKKAKGAFENRVLKLVERTSLKIEDVNGLKKEVDKCKKLYAGLSKLDAAWGKYESGKESEGFSTELPLIPCYPLPSIKAHLLEAASDLCSKGDPMLKKIKKLQKNNSHPIEGKLAEGLKWLEEEVGKYNGDLSVLNEAWKEFVPTDTLNDGVNFGFDYCRTEDRLKAYVMNGMVNICTQGEEMLTKIATIWQEEEPELSQETNDKIEKLINTYQGYQSELDTLNSVWGEFIELEDTLLRPAPLAGFYCDKIAQVQAWLIRGHLSPCDQGQQYLDRIDNLKAAHQLDLDEEVACRLLRLRGKVYQCRYIELVIQARTETHAERERFGPASATIMEGDLNSDKLPCPTTVQYQPLGNIGIQYIISTFLCQDIDLAKMGDPEYYKKIASWVDSEVLQKYCEANMRCKEDFFIYLEGHTDGHAFKGARYKKSLDIPEGTAFTHFLEGEALEKTTEREITTSLRSNMELGIARAWTVKNQLDFMQVPIRVGAYEHPEDEKGGEYRRIEIELNITNLLLDFYEKKLQTLIEESGIGERPGTCE